ncbi:MAG: DNA repair exonuclease [Deltaproteobacteria bacterium]|nr:DNA repair exonuclease [Deltaproteobacteria bacterium]
MVRFLHAADLHIDSPLSACDQAAPRMAARLRAATRTALDNLVTLAVDEQVEFVVIAGDLFDRDRDDFNTARWLTAKFAELGAAGIRVYLVRGNHDAMAKISKVLTWPANVYEFKTTADTAPAFHEGVRLHGRSYKTGAVEDPEFARSYPAPVANCINIGVLHTCASDSGGKVGGHEPYAPCNVGELAAKGYDYWALGHVHTRAILHPQPCIAFPGNPQGRHINEPDAHGCLLVTLAPPDRAVCEFRALDDVRWAKVNVDVSGCRTLGGAVDAAVAEVAQHALRADGRLLAVRLTLEGTTPAHADLVASKPQLLEELRGRFQTSLEDQVHLERAVLATRQATQQVRALGTLRAYATGADRHAESAALEDAALIAAKERVQAAQNKVKAVVADGAVEFPDLDEAAGRKVLLAAARGWIDHEVAATAGEVAP